MTNNIPFLGDVRLYWCPNCNLPLLKPIKCGICGKKDYFQINLTPPADVRPAFKKDIQILCKTIDRQYGPNISEKLLENNPAILFNRIGGLDRTEEIILNGELFGILKYNISSEKYFFKPRLIAGNMIYYLQEKQNIKKKQILINKDGKPFVIRGKSILAPGVKKITNNIEEKDYVFAISEHSDYDHQKICIAIGRSTCNSAKMQEMVENNYGQLAKNDSKFSGLSKRKKMLLEKLFLSNEWPQKKIEIPKKSLNNKNEDFLERIHLFKPFYLTYLANEEYIQKKISSALRFIRKAKKDVKKPIAVAYSGGKDSLATIMLVYLALKDNFKIFFINTGLELPEVENNVVNVAQKLNMENKLIVKRAKDKFWDLIQRFGPPARDYRYCCHTLKAQNVMDIIQNIYDGEKVLTFLGQRRYESLTRAKSRKIYVNSFVPLQIAATPIKSWNALLLWLFILFKPIEINEQLEFLPITPLYFKGQQRLGCYLCPASDLESFKLLEETHPRLIKRWYNFLREYKKKYQLPEEWIKYGLWRFKEYPPQWKIFFEKTDIKPNKLKIKTNQEISIVLTKGFSPCLMSGYSIKGKITNYTPTETTISYFAPLSSNVDFDEDLNIFSLKSSFKGIKYTLNLFSDGSFFLKSNQKNFNYINLVKLFYTSILREKMCKSCEICVSICPNNALKRKNNRIEVNEKLCTSCQKCITHCPLYNKAKKDFSQLKF